MAHSLQIDLIFIVGRAVSKIEEAIIIILVNVHAGSILNSSGLQDSISDPPPPDGAEVRSGDAAQLKPRLIHLLIMSYLSALQGLQSENPLWDLEKFRKKYRSDKSSINKQTSGPAGCDQWDGDTAALTWSLIPVATWPTFTRRASLMRIIRQLKSLMQTSTPGANHRAEIHEFNLQVSCTCEPAGTTMHSVCIWAEIIFNLSSSTFKAARWRQLGVIKQINAEHLHVWLTVGRVDARAEVVSWTQRPAARVLPHMIKRRASADNRSVHSFE